METSQASVFCLPVVTVTFHWYLLIITGKKHKLLHGSFNHENEGFIILKIKKGKNKQVFQLRLNNNQMTFNRAEGAAVKVRACLFKKRKITGSTATKGS